MDPATFRSTAPRKGAWVQTACARLRAVACASIHIAAAIVLGSCGRPSSPPRIAYPYPWLGRELARVAQAAIDARGRPRSAEIPESLLAQIKHATGYAGDIGYAEGVVAMPGLAAAVGPQSSRATLLVAPIYAERHIPLVSATATSDRLSSLGPWLLQLAPDNHEEGAFMARFLLERLAARRVTIFYLDADEYGLGLRDGVVEALRLRGVAPVDEVGIMPETDLPLRVAQSLRRATPDALVIAARAPEASAIVRAVHARMPGLPVLAGDGVPLSAGFLQSAGATGASVYAVAWWSADLPDTASRAFAAAFRRATGALPSPAVAMYYDALMVAAQAVRDVGPRPESVRRYLSELGGARPPYRGVTGPIAFATSRPVNLLMTAVDRGAVVVVPVATAGP